MSACVVFERYKGTRCGEDFVTLGIAYILIPFSSPFCYVFDDY